MTAAAPSMTALAAAVDLRRWIESRDLLGVDPYDALRSPVLRRLGPGRLPRRVWIQLLRRLPVDPRPFVGIRPYPQAKALALIAGASAKLSATTGDDAWTALANRAAEGALELTVETPVGAAWAYPFDVQLRWGFYAAGTPNAIATVFTARGLTTAAELLDRPELAAAAERSVPFLDSLATHGDEPFYAYVPGNSTPIHNANLLVAALRARIAIRRGMRMPDTVMTALAFSLSRQRPDGSWPYGEAPGCEWVDGFHTAYVLSALVDLRESVGGGEVEGAIARGAAYYVENLFEGVGTPRYYAGRTYPLDSHNAATAISTLLLLQDLEPRAKDLAARVTELALARLRTPAGWFVYQRGRFHTKRVSYLRWSDAHMLNALADFSSASKPSS